jgi:hypothetical protein
MGFPPLSGFQRLALCSQTRLSAEKAISIPENELTFASLVKLGAKPQNFGAAGVRPLRLKEMGANSVADLVAAGFTSLWLCDESFSCELVAAFGAADAKQAFLQTASDAVALAGTSAATELSVGVDELLSLCCGLPTEAFEVVRQLEPKDRTQGLRMRTLLDSGLRAPQLRGLGISVSQVRALEGADVKAVAKLGF